MKFVMLSMFVAGLLLFFSGQAQAMRCGNELVQLGDSRMVVMGKCSEPDDIVVSTRERRDGSATVTTVVETWTYNLGPREFLHFLTFNDGKLETIKTGKYGF